MIAVAVAVGAAHGQDVEDVGVLVAMLLATAEAFVNEYKAGKVFDIPTR